MFKAPNNRTLFSWVKALQLAQMKSGDKAQQLAEKSGGKGSAKSLVGSAKTLVK